jgi:hypothetical protein
LHWHYNHQFSPHTPFRNVVLTGAIIHLARRVAVSFFASSFSRRQGLILLIDLDHVQRTEGFGSAFA